MSGMSRERFEELKEAYALGALPKDERREFEKFLAAHTERQAEVDELTSIASLLAVSPADQQPPERLRDNIMAIVGSEAGESRTPSSWRDSLGGLRRLFPGRVALGAAAALIVGLLSWNIFLQSEIQNLTGQNEDLQAQVSDARGNAQGDRVFAMQGEGQMDATEVEIRVFPDDEAVLVAQNMPSIPDGQTFQIWVISGDDIKPSGLFQANGDPVAAVVQESIKDGDTVAITIEPAGGSPQPTMDPMLSARV